MTSGIPALVCFWKYRSPAEPVCLFVARRRIVSPGVASKKTSSWFTIWFLNYTITRWRNSRVNIDGRSISGVGNFFDALAGGLDCEIPSMDISIGAFIMEAVDALNSARNNTDYRFERVFSGKKEEGRGERERLILLPERAIGWQTERGIRSFNYKTIFQQTKNSESNKTSRRIWGRASPRISSQIWIMNRCLRAFFVRTTYNRESTRKKKTL